MTVYHERTTVPQVSPTEVEQQETTAAEKKRLQEEGAKAVGKLLAQFIKPAILMLLWNWLMPGLFGLATIGYLKAFGLYIIARILIDKND